MKAVIYARYSSDNQREESIEGQLRECNDFADKNGIIVLGTYIDRALSAKSDNRPEFQKMIKDSEKEMFDTIIVWKLDRFARNRYDSAHYKANLRKHGVSVISATEAISQDSTGILLESLLEGMAEYYSAELSEKVTRGMTENVYKGKYNGGSVSLGYMIDEEQHFKADPITAPVVLEMFKMYSEGKTIKEIVTEFNKRGIRNSRNGEMTINIVTHVLKNRRYIGEYTFNDMVVYDVIPPIVPTDLFESVQEKIAKNRKAPARHKAKEEMYLLSGKLYCGSCKALMVGESGTGKSKKIYRYYKCATSKNRKGCNRKSLSKDWIENIVIEQVQELLYDDVLLDNLAEMLMAVHNTESSELPLLEQQLAECKKSIDNILNAIQQGVFTVTTKQRLEDLEDTQLMLETQIDKERIFHDVLTKKRILFFLYRFRKLDMNKYEHRQRLVDTFINAIFIYDDRIVFTFNYKDGSKTIEIADLESSDLELHGAPLDNPNMAPIGDRFGLLLYLSTVDTVDRYHDGGIHIKICV